MFNFDRLRTPAEDGEVLVLPSPAACAAAVARNAQTLATANTPFLGGTLAEWREKTRRRLLGEEDRPVIVIGHQPEFTHPGVWAKHIVAQRLAQATQGIAVNVVVDNDAPSSAMLSIPSLDQGRVVLRQLRVVDLPAGHTYEQLSPFSPARVENTRASVEAAMGEAYAPSQMPEFFRAMQAVGAGKDGVSQLIAARRAVEKRFDVALEERRVSGLWWTPLLQEIVRRAAHFTECYNAALAAYRVEHRVRGNHRPMPDLQRISDAVELPLWAVRPGEPRRRVLVVGDDQTATLRTVGDTIATVRFDDWPAWNELVSPLGDVGRWRLRPRALVLTLWARLFLADLFIHGIGGAKYDRICDRLIAEFFHIPPPPFACVSATLRLDLPRTGTTPEAIRATQRELRDRRWNPQRYVTSIPEVAPLLGERNRAVGFAHALREQNADRHARRQAFEAIRDANRTLFATAADSYAKARQSLVARLDEWEQDRIALGREHFFALFDRRKLGRLLDALPDVGDFRV